MNVLLIVPRPGVVPRAAAAWDGMLGPDDGRFAVSLVRSPVVQVAGWEVHPLEIDLTRSPYLGRLLLAAAAPLPAAVNPAWAWLMGHAREEILWNVRAFDPDVVDVRGMPGAPTLARRLRTGLGPVRVVPDGGAGGSDGGTSWRRYDAAAKVSIVLPVYGGARYLRKAIESCLGQTHADLELIVVDDASPDATPEIVAEYARRDGRVVPIRNERNLRLPAALNVGFARSSGQLLTWTSHDNYHAPHAIETLVRYLSTWPDVDLVYSAYRVVDEMDRLAPGVRYPSPPWQAPLWNPVGPCFLYRRRVYEAIGDYRPEMESVEDYDYFVRVSRRFRMMRLPWPLYCYREHPDSMTARRRGFEALRRRLREEHFGPRR